MRATMFNDLFKSEQKSRHGEKENHKLLLFASSVSPNHKFKSHLLFFSLMTIMSKEHCGTEFLKLNVMDDRRLSGSWQSTEGCILRLNEREGLR